MHHLIGWFVDRPLVINMIMGMVFTLGYLTIADDRLQRLPDALDTGSREDAAVDIGAGALGQCVGCMAAFEHG